MIKHTSHHSDLITRTGIVLRKTGVLVLGLVAALLDAMRELLVSTETRHDERRRLHDSDLSGELNYRTGRLDAGTDPYGWYDD